MTMSNEDDCWDAFGDDSSADDASKEDIIHHDAKTIGDEVCQAGVLFLTQHFLRANPDIALSHRRVASLATTAGWDECLTQRNMQRVAPSDLCDAALLKTTSTETPQDKAEEQSILRRNLVPGGILLMVASSESEATEELSKLDEQVWNVQDRKFIYAGQRSGRTLVACTKHSCPINERSCPWKTHSVTLLREERRLLQHATVTRSAHEMVHQTPLTPHGIQAASNALRSHGYCVVRQLVSKEQCLEWGKAVLEDLDEAARILQERDHVDIRHPQNSSEDPQNYREMAMREDLRMDLRNGPHIKGLRREEAMHWQEWGIVDSSPNPQTLLEHNSPIVTTSKGSHKSCLRFHADVLEIARRTMNPKDPTLYKGNFGRYNFDGSGPDGSYQPLRIGPMGGIVSLPGSADQALHADTPHLFEHLDCLPPHYINAFCIGTHLNKEATDPDGNVTGATNVGGTAFVHGSHRLQFTSQLSTTSDDDSSTSLASMSGRSEMLKHLVRPSLQLGDVVLFDCRILHFGLANTSKSGVERPMLYVNMTHAWFHDPKNWDDRRCIFE